MKTTLCVFGSLLLLAAGARADEVRLVDGRVLYGKVTEGKDTWQIETREGTVKFAKAELAQRTKDEDLRARLRDLAQNVGDSPFAHLQLAIQARTYALEPELWQHLDRVVAGDAEAREPIQKRLEDFLAQLEPELLPRKWRTADTTARVRELLAKHRKSDGAGRRAALVELLRREPNADKDLRHQARRNSEPARRVLAVDALVGRGTAGNDSFAWRTAILDNDRWVRAQAVAITKKHGIAAGAVTYLAPGLMHSSPDIRVRTAEAYERLGDGAAIKLLVLAGPNAGKSLAAADQGARAHVAFVQQQSYIRDFDVEVAQASFIADPKVDVIQSGTVLDVTVHGVYEEQVIVRAYRSALAGLGGSDPGADPRGWATWLMRNQEQSPAPAPATPTGAPTPSQPEPKK